MVNIILLVFIILGINFLFWGIFAFYYNVKLLLYLKKHYNKLWKSLVINNSFGVGAVNMLTYPEYFYKKDKEKDKKILRYKRLVNLGFKYEIISAIIIVISMVVSYLLYL